MQRGWGEEINNRTAYHPIKGDAGKETDKGRRGIKHGAVSARDGPRFPQKIHQTDVDTKSRKPANSAHSQSATWSHFRHEDVGNVRVKFREPLTVDALRPVVDLPVDQLPEVVDDGRQVHVSLQALQDRR